MIAAIVAAALALSAPAPPTQVFVLAGQSNMAGRGMPISAGEPSDPRLFAWTRKVGWKVAADPLEYRPSSESGVGPGMSFGLALVHADPNATVGLVNCAVGGTGIIDWQPTGALYQACIGYARAAVPGGHVAGVLFLQGERDARTSSDAKAWSKRFLPVAAAFKRDVGGRLLLGQIGTLLDPAFRFQKIVRDQQALAAATLKVPLVLTSDLATGPDGVHFTVASYKTIGVRFAAAWCSTASAWMQKAA